MIVGNKSLKSVNTKYKDCPCAEAKETITIPMECRQEEAQRQRKCVCFGPSCIPILFILSLLLIVLLLPLGTQERHKASATSEFTHQFHSEPTDYECKLQLVESIPLGLNYSKGSPEFLSTYDAWKLLLDLANKTVNIGSFYWTLRGEDVVPHPSAKQGEDIFNQILANADEENRLNISIAQSEPTSNEPNVDTQIFSKYKAAQVRSVDFPKLFGGGVLHTKLWIIDGKHFYIGSANMDWRALTQVKELGVLGQNCSLLAEDVQKIFKAYWFLGKKDATVPKPWPSEFSTSINSKHPAAIGYNGTNKAWAYFSNSPPPLTAIGRTHDLQAIIETITSAKKFIHIAVMDYFPLMLYTKEIQYWPYIDDAIRAAAIERKVSIKMLISWWQHSRPSEDYFLRSLKSLSSALEHVDIEIRRFIVPSDSDQKKIPYGRVNHNKYMVTDEVAYIGTSNWSGDYFTNTAGIGFVLRDDMATRNSSKRTIRSDLAAVFKRDWESPYAVALSDEVIN